MFAIRQKSTGWWLPPFSGRAGGTHVEPSATAMPRLFGRHQDARAALSWWLEGKVTAFYSFDGEYEGDLKTSPVKSRSADDMEIVEVSVVPV